MGRAADSGRVAAAGLRCGRVHRGQVQGPADATAVADWRSFLVNHVNCLASVDFFVVPTATFRLLYGFLVLRHDRRLVAHFNVPAHPTADWVARQIKEAFPYDEAPRYLIRDRDGAYGDCFRESLKRMGVEEVLTRRGRPGRIPTSSD